MDQKYTRSKSPFPPRTNPSSKTFWPYRACADFDESANPNEHSFFLCHRDHQRIASHIVCIAVRYQNTKIGMLGFSPPTRMVQTLQPFTTHNKHTATYVAMICELDGVLAYEVAYKEFESTKFDACG
jgi:hypothetical protein